MLRGEKVGPANQLRRVSDPCLSADEHSSAGGGRRHAQEHTAGACIWSRRPPGRRHEIDIHGGGAFYDRRWHRKRRVGESGAYDARAHALACHIGRRHALNYNQIGGRTRYRRPYNTAGYQHVVGNWISNSGCRKHKPPFSVVEVSLWHIPGCDQDHSRLTGNRVAGCIFKSIM